MVKHDQARRFAPACRFLAKRELLESFMMSGLDGSGAVHTVLPWGAFGGHVPSGGSEMYWFDQSIPIGLKVLQGAMQAGGP